MDPIVIYCDFDGTVTEKDNIISMMKNYALDGWESIKEQVLSQSISIREGVGKLFSTLPSNLKGELTKFALENARIRSGFSEFVKFAKNKEIPLYIVSGGIDFFVRPILESYGPFADIYCNEADFSNNHIKINWPHLCDDQCSNDCGCCKTSIIRNHKNTNSFNIVIGDSVTDLEAAKQADFVLARDLLLEKCREWDIAHQSFETFYDCIEAIKRLEVNIVNA